MGGDQIHEIFVRHARNRKANVVSAKLKCYHRIHNIYSAVLYTKVPKVAPSLCKLSNTISIVIGQRITAVSTRAAWSEHRA
jgi:hypothetical protein